MTQMQFNLEAGEKAKVRGLTLAEIHRSSLLMTARSAARLIARSKGSVTIDDVVEAMAERGHGLLGNASGSVFKGSEWEFTGQWVKSARVSNHARMNRVWKLK